MSSSTPASCADGSPSRPSRNAARATASASMRSDLPRSRPARRASLISLVGTRTTRSPRPSRNRSKEPDTCRQSSSAQTRSSPSPRAQSQQRERSRASPTSIVLPAQQLAGSPRRSPRRCASACACPPRARSWLVLLSISTDSWTPGGHGLLEGAATLLICAGTRRQAPVRRCRGDCSGGRGCVGAVEWCGSCARGRPALSRSAIPPCGGPAT